MPLITDEREAARDVPLAAFSAMTHGRGPQAAAIRETLATALQTLDPDTAAVFAQFTESCLVDPQAKQIWRDLMTAINYFLRHEVAEKVREEGREEGRLEDRADMTLNILQWRGIEVPDPVRERVRARADMGQLDIWARRAVHATDAAQLFEGD